MIILVKKKYFFICIVILVVVVGLFIFSPVVGRPEEQIRPKEDDKNTEKKEFVYDCHGKKDPFSPPQLTHMEEIDTEALTGVNIEAIIWDEDNPMVLINDKVLGVGDCISGAKIIEIKENEVTFEVNGENFTKKLRTLQEGAI